MNLTIVDNLKIPTKFKDLAYYMPFILEGLVADLHNLYIKTGARSAVVFTLHGKQVCHDMNPNVEVTVVEVTDITVKKV